MKVILNSNFTNFAISELAYFELIRRDGIYPKDKKSIRDFMILIGEESWSKFINELINYKDEFLKHPLYENELIRAGFVYSTNDYIHDYRYNHVLISIVEELGQLASGEDSLLKVVEIPNDVKYYYIDTNNGVESIHETHRVWSGLCQ
jgi:hypothetical protein